MTASAFENSTHTHTHTCALFKLQWYLDSLQACRLSGEVCLCAGDDWLKLTCQSEGSDSSVPLRKDFTRFRTLYPIKRPFISSRVFFTGVQNTWSAVALKLMEYTSRGVAAGTETSNKVHCIDK